MDSPRAPLVPSETPEPDDAGTKPMGPSRANETSFLTRLRATLAKWGRSEVQPTVISDKSGERFLGIKWTRWF